MTSVLVHRALRPMRSNLVGNEPMRSSIRSVSHPAEQEMMKLPAQVCGECVMWTVAHYSPQDDHCGGLLPVICVDVHAAHVHVGVDVVGHIVLGPLAPRVLGADVVVDVLHLLHVGLHLSLLGLADPPLLGLLDEPVLVVILAPPALTLLPLPGLVRGGGGWLCIIGQL